MWAMIEVTDMLHERVGKRKVQVRQIRGRHAPRLLRQPAILAGLGRGLLARAGTTTHWVWSPRRISRRAPAWPCRPCRDHLDELLGRRRCRCRRSTARCRLPGGPAWSAWPLTARTHHAALDLQLGLRGGRHRRHRQAQGGGQRRGSFLGSAFRGRGRLALRDFGHLDAERDVLALAPYLQGRSGAGLGLARPCAAESDQRAIGLLLKRGMHIARLHAGAVRPGCRPPRC